MKLLIVDDSFLDAHLDGFGLIGSIDNIEKRNLRGMGRATVADEIANIIEKNQQAFNIGCDQSEVDRDRQADRLLDE